MTSLNDTTHLESQLSSLFRVEAEQAHLPQETWQAIRPQMGEPNAPSVLWRLSNAISFPRWKNPLMNAKTVRYAAPAATILLAAIAAVLFILLVNDDEDGPVPAATPTPEQQTPTPPPATEAPTVERPDELAAIITTLASQDRFLSIIDYVTPEFAAFSEDVFENAMRASLVWQQATEAGDWTIEFTSQGFAVAHLNELPAASLVFKLIDGEWRLDPGPFALRSAYFVIDEEAVNGPLLDSEANVTFFGDIPQRGEPQERPRFTRIDQDRFVYATELQARTSSTAHVDFNEAQWMIDGVVEPVTLLWASGFEKQPGVFEYPGDESANWFTDVMLATSGPVDEGTNMELRLTITIGEGSEAYGATIVRTFQAGNVRVPGSLDTSPAPASPTPIPTPTPSPIPTPSPMEIVPIADLGEPVSGTVYEELLSRIPDTANAREFLRLSDFAGTWELLGIPAIQPGTDAEAALDQFLGYIDRTGQSDELQPNSPAWPLGMRDYLSRIDWYTDVAFDPWSVDQAATAGTPPNLYDVALGDFDPAATSNALASCECEQPDIQTHEGVDFYSWGEGGVGDIAKRFSRPLYDHVGRGPRVLVGDDEAYWTTFDEEMESLIDVASGTTPSLASNSDFAETVAWMNSLGFMRDITLLSTGFSIDEAVTLPGRSQGSTEVLFREVLLETPLMLPFELAASGSGLFEDRVFVGLVISNSDAPTAAQNVALLEERLRNVRIDDRSDARWSDLIDRVEIAQEDRFVLARIYFNDPPRQLQLGAAISFLVHE